jgi:hypothetical protein
LPFLLPRQSRRLDLRSHLEGWTILLCTSLALVPILLLYALSVGTSIHVFVPRYRLEAVPGIALCWALVASRIDSRALRLLACTTIVAATAAIYLTTPLLRQHQYSWKYALEFVEKNASVDDAPVLICSDIPESDHMAMPVGSAILESGILPPLSYYKLSVPVTPLPRALNDEAMRDGSRFLQQAAQRHQRFLAMGLRSLTRRSIGFETRLGERSTFASWEHLTESRYWNLCPVAACQVHRANGHYLAAVRLTRYKLEST